MKNLSPLFSLLSLTCLLYLPGLVLASNDSSGEPLTRNLHTRTGQVRFSFEQLDMPRSGENLGLLGFSYLFDLDRGLYAGIGGYGAMSGERGGFFTGGIEGGYRRSLIGPLHADLGLFVGGGGGGSAPQGGGLMLRPHLGLGLTLKSLGLGLGYSKVKFPNGDIDSDQLMVSLSIPFSSLHGSNQDRTSLTSAGESRLGDHILPLDFTEENLVLTARSYFPAGSSLTTTVGKLDPRLDLAGFEYRRFFSPAGFFLTEFGGAVGGSADGYAEVLFGGGYRISLKQGRGLEGTASLALGGAGGGGVKTGGGVVGRGALSLGWRFTSALSASLEGGYISAFDGDFDAVSAGVKLAYSLETAVPSRGVRSGHRTDRIRLAGWKVRAAHQSYLAPQRKSNISNSDDVHLIAAKADLMVTRGLYLTGQAAGAYDGDAGGYAVGLVGMGWQSAPLTLWGLRFSGELLAGAAGGGGIDVGDGAIVQPMLGLGRDLGESFSILAQAGRVLAISGDLNATVVELGVSYHFTTPVLARE